MTGQDQDIAPTLTLHGISYDQIRFVVDHLHRRGCHIVPATEETVKVALRANEVESLFQLTAAKEGDR